MCNERYLICNRCDGNWPLLNDLAGPYLTRELARNYNYLPSQFEIGNILTVLIYDSAPYDDTTQCQISFRNSLEGWPHTGTEGYL